MSGKTKRKFWQIHLSTAVIMMLGAAVVIRLNFLYDVFSEKVLGRTHYLFQGWPIYCYGLSYNCYPGNDSHPAQILFGPLLTDCVVGAGLLVLTAFLSEFLIRRREARKR